MSTDDGNRAWRQIQSELRENDENRWLLRNRAKYVDGPTGEQLVFTSAQKREAERLDAERKRLVEAQAALLHSRL